MVQGWGRRRWIAAGAAAAAVVVIVAITVAVRAAKGPDTIDDVGDPLSAARTADKVPSGGPALTDLPYDCGMPHDVLKRLVGDVDKQESQEPGRDSCTWGDVDGLSSVDGAHGLDVKVWAKTSGGSADPAAAIGQLGDSVDSARSMLADDDAPGPITAMSGPGDQAAAWTVVRKSGSTKVVDPHDKHVLRGTAATTIAFTAGNVAALVTYGGADVGDKGLDTAKHPLEPTTLKAMMPAVTRLARALGIPVRDTPRAVPAPAGTPVTDLPASCELAPAETVRAAGDNTGLRPEKDDSLLFGEKDAEADQGITGDSCHWKGGIGHSVEVQSITVDAESPLGAGATVARREYLRQYRDARDTPGGTASEAAFTALRGLGEQAFANYEKHDILDGGAGLVTFRARNALVQVRCWDIDTYPPDDALNCAYTVARAAAKRVVA